MIYNKKVAFPYPLLMNGLTHYKDEYFDLDIELLENIDSISIEYDFKLCSKFIKLLLERGEVTPILIISSRDSKYFRIENFDKIDDSYYGKIEVSKKRISLKDKIRFQVIIESKNRLNYKTNNDLVDFYDEMKSEINIPQNAAIAISNEVVFDGNIDNATRLFEIKVNKEQILDIKIQLSEDIILINLNKSYSNISSLKNKKVLDYPLLYMGLQKAFYEFIIKINKLLNQNTVSKIKISDIDNNDIKGLNYKLYSLLKDSKIEYIDFENVDYVINEIFGDSLNKYFLELKRLSESGN